MWRGSTIITCHLVLNVWMKLPVHWSILDNRFSELKKKLDGKFLKPLMKNFKIWLLPLKETFVDALNTSDIHSNNFNFVSSKRGWFFWNRKIDSFPKEKIFPFGNNCWKGFAVWTDYVFQIKFYIKICKKPASWFFISYNCFILVFTSSADIIFLIFLELLHLTLLQKRFLSQIFFFKKQIHWNPSTPFNTTTAKIC